MLKLLKLCVAPAEWKRQGLKKKEDSKEIIPS